MGIASRMTDRLKVLHISDGGVQTGFGRATHGLWDRLVTNHGHEVSILATNYRGDHFSTPCRLYVPTMLDPKDLYGRSRFLEMLGKVEPDVVTMLGDPFVLLNHLFQNKRYDPTQILLRYRPIVTYQPRDGINGPKTWDKLREIPGPKGEPFTVSRQVAMTKFGQAQMPDSDLVYHGVDSSIFYPVSRERPITLANGTQIKSKREAKAAFGYPEDAFLVLRVDSNNARKDYASSWKALVPVMKQHSDIIVHFHCSGNDWSGGVQMPALWTRDMETAPRFHLADEFDTFENWPIEHLVMLYNAADVFLSTSQGEGFGLTLLEAAACGLPIIAQNVSAMPEVVGPGGILIEGGFQITAPGGQDMFAANIPAFTEAIEYLYLNEGFRKRYGRAAAKHARETFNWDVEAAKLNDIITETVAQTELVAATA